MNGGGGYQFNDNISIETIAKMREVCFRHGTSSFLPSMISAAFEDVKKSLEVVKEWVDIHGLENGVVGIHLEGPFLSVEKRGIHDQTLLQNPTREKMELIASYAKQFPVLMTIAPERASVEDVRYLSSEGVILSVGHSNASYEITEKCF
jgi:N-acetylglucosamine-6-phosphate deacetylase